MASHPTIGVEEEFLLVDPDIRRTGRRQRSRSPRTPPSAGSKLQLELTSCQVETTSDVVGGSGELRDQLTPAAPRRRRGRRGQRGAATGRRAAADRAARVPDHGHPALPRDRRQVRHDRPRAGHLRMPRARRGAEPRGRDPGQQPAAAVAAAAARADRQLGGVPHADTGYASWRSVLWARWPSAGPPPHFDSVDEYDAVVRCCATPARCSTTAWSIGMCARRPTSRPIEVRVADVPATVGETVLLATLIRACVMTALDDERRGEPIPPLAPHALKAAYWKSARDGLDGEAVDSGKPSARARANVVGPPRRIAYGRPWKRSATTNWCAANSIAFSSRATGRCGSGGRSRRAVRWLT